ncbi:DcrB-related protein [Enterobacteriaceae bacterium LUAb1]
MSTKQLSYKLYEGTFQTEEPVLDRTVNLMLFRDPDGKEYQIIITRVSLQEDQTPEEWCETELSRLQNTLPGFQMDGKQLTHAIGPAKLPVIQVANRYLLDGNMTLQVQTIIKLPQHSRYNPAETDMIIFSLNAIDDFTEYQRKHYVQVINSFTPTPEHNIK